jgi:hypothetical protein
MLHTRNIGVGLGSVGLCVGSVGLGVGSVGLDVANSDNRGGLDHTAWHGSDQAMHPASRLMYHMSTSSSLNSSTAGPDGGAGGGKPLNDAYSGNSATAAPGWCLGRMCLVFWQHTHKTHMPCTQHVPVLQPSTYAHTHTVLVYMRTKTTHTHTHTRLAAAHVRSHTDTHRTHHIIKH